MSNAMFNVPVVSNEPVMGYAPGSPERAELQWMLKKLASKKIDIPARIGGRNVRTGKLGHAVMPHDHQHELAQYHKCGKAETKQAIEAALAARDEWSRMPWQARAAIFLKAADLLAGPYRMVMNAATMLNQSKTCHQAEIDAACEMIDFWRYNCEFMQQIYAEQPESSPGCWNMLEHRPLDGFVFAVTPFNFTSIAGNLPAAPALMGNYQQPRQFLYREFPGGGGQQSIRVGDWKAIRQNVLRGNLGIELYNLATDPGEQNNLVAANPEIVDKLKRRLAIALQEMKAEMPRVNDGFKPGAKGKRYHLKYTMELAEKERRLFESRLKQ